MKANLTPFVDLFSILAIGLLLIMTVTSGTDKPDKQRPNIRVVMFYLVIPESIADDYPGIPMEKLLDINPYFLVNGKEVPLSSLNITIDVQQRPESITLYIKGNPKDVSVGFRVKKVVNKSVIFEEFGVSVVATSNNQSKGGNNETKSKLTIGKWVDPIVPL